VHRSKFNNAIRGGIASGALAASLALGGCGASGDSIETSVADAARELGQGLPRVAEMSSITAIRAEGAQLVYEMTLDPWLTPELLQSFRIRAEQSERLRLCNDTNTRGLIERGAAVVSRFSHTGGTNFETRIASCQDPSVLAPAAPPSLEADLSGQISSAVVVLSSGLPRQVDAVTTLTAVRAEGTRIFYELSINRDLSRAELETMRPNLQAGLRTQLCADPASRRLLLAGATMRHRYTDPSGDRIETSVESCPPAAGGGG
jgi:hypothetical protein